MHPTESTGTRGRHCEGIMEQPSVSKHVFSPLRVITEATGVSLPSSPLKCQVPISCEVATCCGSDSIGQQLMINTEGSILAPCKPPARQASKQHSMYSCVKQQHIEWLSCEYSAQGHSLFCPDGLLPLGPDNFRSIGQRESFFHKRGTQRRAASC